MADDLNPTGAARHRGAALLAVAAAVLAIGVPVALANRSSPDQQVAAAQPAAAEERTLPPVPSLPAGEQPPAATPPASAQPVVKGMPNEDGCPVDATRLLTALHASDLPADLADSEYVADVQCYATYAVAVTGPATAKPATVVFRYTEMTNSWRAVSGVGSRSCDGVPEAVRPHLRRCATTG